MIQNYKTFLTFRDGNVKEWMGIKVISVNNNNSNYQLYLKISSYNPTYADFLTLNHVKNVKKMVNKQIIEVTDWAVAFRFLSLGSFSKIFLSHTSLLKISLMLVVSVQPKVKIHNAVFFLCTQVSVSLNYNSALNLHSLVICLGEKKI